MTDKKLFESIAQKGVLVQAKTDWLHYEPRQPVRQVQAGDKILLAGGNARGVIKQKWAVEVETSGASGNASMGEGE